MKSAARISICSGINWLARTGIVSIMLLLLLGTSLGLHETIASTWKFSIKHAGSALNVLEILALAVFVVAICVATINLARRAQPFRPAAFLLALLCGGFAVHMLLVFFVQPTWGTDYLRYWQHAQEMVREGKYGGFNSPYYSRALFIPYVIVKLFGPDAELALKIANAALLGFIQLFAYDILRRIRSHQAAQAGGLLFLSAPLPAYATLIPSHDLWGMFFLSIVVWLITLALYPGSETRIKPWRWVTLAIFAGLFAYIAQVQRSTGTILCVALLIAAFMNWLVSGDKKSASAAPLHSRIALYVAIICFGSQLGFSLIGNRLELQPQGRETLSMMKFAANSGGLGNGKSDWFARFRDRFGEKQASPMEAADFAVSLGLSSWSLQPLDRLAHMANQAQRLFSLNYPMDWNWLLRHPKNLPDHIRAMLIVYAGIYGVVFGFLLVYSLIVLSTARKLAPVPVLTLLIAIFGLALVLLTLFENKPFNIFPIWFAAALAISFVLARPQLAEAGSIYTSISGRWRTAFGGVGLIVVLGLALFIALRCTYGVADGRLLSNWSFQDHQKASASDTHWQSALLNARPEAFDASAYDPHVLARSYINHAGEDGKRIQTYAGDTVTRMAFPAPISEGDQLDLETRVCTAERHRMEFFIYSPKSSHQSNGKFSLDVSVDGEDSRNVAIPLGGENFQRFVADGPFAGHACHKLAFRLRADELSADKIDETAAPYVEIWLPRLIH